MIEINTFAFIIPYFGRFNNYFPLFLLSCSYNKGFDFLLFTDDKTPYDYPDNVKVHYCNFSDIQALIRNKIGEESCIERPYKLCDYRPMYGWIFTEYLSGYKAWGYCDSDVVFGDISRFVEENDFDDYDKIGVLGHCTLFRNTDDINKAFMKPLRGKYRYKEIISTDKNNSFDEELKDSINNIFLENNLKIKEDVGTANLYMKTSNFRLTKYDFINNCYVTEKNKQAVFIWDKGKLIRYEMHKSGLVVKEYCYLHMQSRPMKVNIMLEDGIDCFKIIPNSFDALEVYPITSENFSCIKKKHFNLHYFRLRFKNLLIKLQRTLNGD